MKLLVPRVNGRENLTVPMLPPQSGPTRSSFTDPFFLNKKMVCYILVSEHSTVSNDVEPPIVLVF